MRGTPIARRGCGTRDNDQDHRFAPVELASLLGLSCLQFAALGDT